MAPGGRSPGEPHHVLHSALAVGPDAQKKSFLFIERRPAQREAWLREIERVAPEKRVYIDEAGAEDTLTRLFGWSPRGQRCLGQRRGHAKERISMVAAWCRRSSGKAGAQAQVLAPFTFRGTCDALLFEWWFEHRLLPLLEPGQVVILDNATFHRKKKLRALLEKKGCTLLPLPAYSPDFNPIEHLWNTIKHHIRHNTNHSLSLWDKVDAAFCSL